MRRIGFIKLFGSPFEGCQTESMGPLFDESRVDLAEFLPAFVDYLERRMGVAHIEFASNSLAQGPMEGLGFEGQQVPTYRVELTPCDEARTWDRLEGKVRTGCRKAVKAGLSVRMEKQEGFAAECYEHIKEVFTRRGKAVPFGAGRVRVLLRALQESDQVIAMSVRLPESDAPIATGIFLVDGRELILWSWTHCKKYGSLRPTELLTWTAMQEGMKRGCTTLDMAGGGEAKVKFGASLDGRGFRWLRTRYGWLGVARSLAKRTYRFQQRLRGRIGLQRTEAVGRKAEVGGV